MKSAAYAVLSIIVSCMAVAGCSEAPHSGKSSANLDKALAGVYPALVRINVVLTSPDEGRMEKMQASGSGAIISGDGYVITNHHVAGKSEHIVCRLADRQEIDAVLIGSDPMADIAVLKLKLDQLKDKGASLPVATFGDSDKLAIGQTVLAMGSPAGLSQCVTVGVVSNTQMILPYGAFMMDGEAVGTVVRWIGHDATIFHGNSGGPLVNLDGQIVGINEMGVGGIGGAIPGNLAKGIARQIIDNKGKVRRSWTGIEPQAMLKSSTGPRGVLVGGVVSSSPAANAGMQSGDIVIAVNGQHVQAVVGEELPMFNQLVLSLPIGQKVRVEAIRDGEDQTFEFATVSRDAAVGGDFELKAWGMTAMDYTALSAMEAQRPKEGAIIQTIRKGGPCTEAKPSLEAEDVITEVNGRKIGNVADLKAITAEITRNNEQKVEALVCYERGMQKYLSVIRIGKEDDKNKPASAKKAWIGIKTQVLMKDLAKALNLGGKSGVRVTQVLPGTNAQSAGLMVGDVLLKFDGDAIDASLEGHEKVFERMVDKRPIDKTVTLDIVRDGKEMSLDIVLQAPPAESSTLKSYRDTDFEFTAREMSFFDRTDKKFAQEVTGVLIERVDNAGWAAIGGLRMDDVLMSIDGKAVTDVSGLEKMLKAAKTAKTARLVFKVKRGIHTRFLEISPGWE